MKTQTLTVNATFIEPLLGTCSANPLIHEEHIASKAETASQTKEEVSAITPEDVQAQIEKQTTIFPKDDTGLFLWDYQVKGFIKEAIGILTELGDGGRITKWTFKKIVDDVVFISPRRIYLLDPSDVPFKAATEFCQRPLRATTMQGDRIALARSEMLPIGTKCKFAVSLLVSENAKSRSSDLTLALLEQALDYGKLKGIGQWRNSGHGRFECVIK